MWKKQDDFYYYLNNIKLQIHIYFPNIIGGMVQGVFSKKWCGLPNEKTLHKDE